MSDSKCKCGRKLCDLCGENAAVLRMKNTVNGNRIDVCGVCYQSIWGDQKQGSEVEQ